MRDFISEQSLKSIHQIHYGGPAQEHLVGAWPHAVLPSNKPRAQLTCCNGDKSI